MEDLPAKLYNPTTSTQMLKFKLVSSDGGEFSEDYSCENMLRSDSSVYCTSRKENTNVILKFASDSSFVLTHVIIKSPEQGFTNPIGSGLIFVTEDVPDIEKTQIFNGFTSQQYKQFVNRNGDNLKETDPAIFFNLEKDECYTIIKLHPPRWGRYILIKLIRSKTRGDNIDVQFIGFKGFVGKHAFGYGELL